MQKKHSGMEALAAFIVDKRKLIIALFILSGISCVFTAKLVGVEDNIAYFLSEETETRQGIEAMEGEFYTFGTARIMVENISLERAQSMAEDMAAVEGVKSVSFDDSKAHYRDRAALFDVTFTGAEDDKVSINALSDLKDIAGAYGEYAVSSSGDEDIAQSIIEEMVYVGIVAVIIVIGVLLLTSRSFGEVPVLLITFGAAALLQMGTNWWFGTISFVSNSVTLILQLALAIDYAIILCNRYAEERRLLAPRDAMVKALSKAIPEISASSLTTIGGLLAMIFMEFRMGYDLGRVLIKAIVFSMLSVFLLMPGIIMVFSRFIEKTRHRSFIPNISGVGRFAWKTRNIVPPLFVLLIVAGFYFSSQSPLAYNYDDCLPVNLNETQDQRQQISERFGEENLMVLVVPAGDYDTEAKMLNEISQLKDVKSTLGLAGVEVMDGYRLGDKISIDEFSSLAGLDETSATALFAYYAASNSDFDDLEALHEYKVPLVDLFLFLRQVVDEGVVDVGDDNRALIDSLYGQLTDAKKQLEGKKYHRMLVYADLPVDCQESYDLVTEIHNVAESYYGGDVYVTGNATCARDSASSFGGDQLMTTLLSLLFVVLVIVFTFRSVGLAFLLIGVIQGSIWLNFTIPYFTGTSIFFVGYLIVSSIQMGANIDYAIVVSNRYLELRERLDRKEAVIGALNGALPTLVTSGSILACAGLLIGIMTSEPTTSGIGIALGRGTAISLVLVMFVLPQVLIWGDKLIRKTKIAKKLKFIVPPRFEGDFEAAAMAEKEKGSAAGGKQGGCRTVKGNVK